MAALFPRLHVWLGLEVITNADLNAEFDNILNNLGASTISGFSQNVTQMRLTESPGTFNSEVLATSVAEEIEQIRFQLNAIIQGPNNVWYDTPALSLSQINTLLTPGGVPSNRIVSGRTSANSQQPMFLVPAGSSASVTLRASTSVPFVIVINGTTYTFTSNMVLSSLGQPPVTNNTFLINDTNAGNQAETKNFGDYIPSFTERPDLSISILTDYNLVGQTNGSSITPLAGTYAAFEYDGGGPKEYFIGFIKSAATGGAITLTKCFRGFFFNSSDAGIPAVGMANGVAVTLMDLVWIYVTTSGTLFASYTNPRYSSIQPATSAAGDMWYDMINNKWKQSNGATYSDANAGLVGICVTDGTNCVAARSFDTNKPYSQFSNVTPEWKSITEIRSKRYQNSVNVYGNLISFDRDAIRWTTATLDTGTTLSVSNTYYLYLTEKGTPLVSKYYPHKRFELGGYYHPFESYRCIGFILYNSSGEFDQYSFIGINEVDGDFINDKTLSISKRRLHALLPSAPLDGFARGSDSGAYTNATNTDTNVGGTATLVTSGRPVFVGLVPTSTTQSNISISPDASGNAHAQFSIYKDAVLFKRFSQQFLGVVALNGVQVPSSSLWTIDLSCTPGQHVYQLKANCDGGGMSVAVNSVQLVAYEL